MPYFHATAVFEARGSSVDEADRRVAALFKTLHHQRVRYHEHDTGGGAGPSPSARIPYFSVIADFDVEAPNEEKAGDLVEEVLDALSTDEIQYLAHGLTEGEPRVRPEQPAPREEKQEREQEHEPRPEARAERGGRQERGGRGRGSRGRGRRRGGDREAEGPREEKPQELATRSQAEEPAATQPEVLPPRVPEEGRAAARSPLVEREPLPPAPAPVAINIPPPAPMRSSSSMRVTLSVTLHASELSFPTNGSTLPDQEELIALATAEARRRHPELPADITPESEVMSQPWGDTVLTLTWHYDVPVPSAIDAA